MTFPLERSVAVVTGAASGIGAELAHALAVRRCNLALVDRAAPALAGVAAMSRTKGVKVTEHVVDVGDATAVAALPGKVLDGHGRVNLLINNAGVALLGTFKEVALADMEWLIAINYWGVVRMCKAFLPILEREPIAQIVNLSSVFGLIVPPGQTAYASSKFAVRGFSEALRHELAGTSIGVSVVHPGGIKTNIAASARIGAGADPAQKAAVTPRFEQLARTTAAEAASRIVAGIDKREKRILIGRDARQIALIQWLFPVSYWKILGRRAEPASH